MVELPENHGWLLQGISNFGFWYMITHLQKLDFPRNFLKHLQTMVVQCFSHETLFGFPSSIHGFTISTMPPRYDLRNGPPRCPGPSFRGFAPPRAWHQCQWAPAADLQQDLHAGRADVTPIAGLISFGHGHVLRWKMPWKMPCKMSDIGNV